MNCVAAAEKTLKEYKEFLKEEKYGEWNKEEDKRHEERIKAMIGETPTGIPHAKKAEIVAAEKAESAEAEDGGESAGTEEQQGQGE